LLPTASVDNWGRRVDQTLDTASLRPLAMTVRYLVDGTPDDFDATSASLLDAWWGTPVRLTGPTGVVAEVQLDALGQVTATVALGRPASSGFSEHLLDDHDHPTTVVTWSWPAVTDGAWTPMVVHTQAREVHHHRATGDVRMQESWTWLDGMGRVLQTKVRVRDDENDDPQYVTSGRVVLDAKGQPIRQYEPFFASHPDFELSEQAGDVYKEVRYDPLGRAVQTNFPDGTTAKVVWTPWSSAQLDRIEQLNGVLDFFRGELKVARDDNNIFGHKFPNQTRMAAVVNCHIEAAITQLPVGFNRRYSPVSVRQREKSVAGRGQRQVEK
jgi:hypothetical protein